jgi:hypothetical protein
MYIVCIYVSYSDKLVVSVGGNDIAMAPAMCTRTFTHIHTHTYHRPSDTLVVSVGGNDIAMAPAMCTRTYTHTHTHITGLATHL